MSRDSVDGRLKSRPLSLLAQEFLMLRLPSFDIAETQTVCLIQFPLLEQL
jgi:hypothetical protein